MLIKIRDQHIGTFPGKGNGHGPANARIPAGNNRFFTRQTAGTLIALFAVIGLWLHRGSTAWPRLLLRGKRGEWTLSG
jgi:hypothetical protein